MSDICRGYDTANDYCECLSEKIGYDKENCLANYTESERNRGGKKSYKKRKASKKNCRKTVTKRSKKHSGKRRKHSARKNI